MSTGFAKESRITNLESDTANIKMNGTVGVGTSANVPRADHVHPYDSVNIPLGMTIPYAGISAPNSSWKICDGSAISKTTYAGLWALMRSLTIGTAGTGACTFADTNDVVTCAGHGLSQGDCIYFSSIISTTGISVDTNYFVCHVATDTFRVATTLANALADTETTLTTDGSGVLVYAPFGISTSANFCIPDLRGVSIGGAGVGALGTTVETFRLGVFYDDKMQGWQLGASADSTGARDYWARTVSRDYRNTDLSAADYTSLMVNKTWQGGTQIFKAMSDGTNGTPRTGTVTRGKVVGTNYIIKVL
jgi:hypothetical protein